MKSKDALEMMEMEIIIDEYPDLSWLKTDYVETDSGLKIIESCRYSYDDIKTCGGDKVLQWINEDHKRLDSYGYDWHMVGIRAKFDYWLDKGSYKTKHTFTSAGLWGIESDSGDNYFNEVFNEEKQNLLDDLQQMGIVKD